jgi:tetratricopeptide (TPR) repeat protein
MKQFPAAIRRRIPVLPVLATLALASPGLAPQLLAQSLDGSTVVSMGNRAQQAFLRADTAALERIESDTRSWQRSPDPMTLYGHAFVKFRVMQSARDARREEQAEAAGEACVDALDTAIKANPRFTDAYNLRAACHVYLGSASLISWFMHRSDAADDIEQSLRLAPRNPRALFVDGLLNWFGPGFFGDQEKGCERFIEAATAFGKDDPASNIRWGAPESHFWAGRCKRQEGDREAEQQFFERALQLAPGYVAAQRALGR